MPILIDQEVKDDRPRIAWQSKEKKKEINAITNTGTLSDLRNQVLSVVDSWSITPAQAEKPVSKSQAIVFDRLLRKKGFKKMYNQLHDDVYLNLTAYDDEFLRPTRYAFNSAMQLLVSSGGRLQGTFPVAWVCADGAGGLSFEWRNLDRKLVLLVPASTRENIVLYFESGTTQIVDENVTVSNMLQRLDEMRHQKEL